VKRLARTLLARGLAVKPRTFQLTLISCLFILGLWPIFAFRKLIGGKLFFAALILPLLVSLPSVVRLLYTFPVMCRMTSVGFMNYAISQHAPPPTGFVLRLWDVMMYGSLWQIDFIMASVIGGFTLCTITVDCLVCRKLIKRIVAFVPELSLATNNSRRFGRFKKPFAKIDLVANRIDCSSS